MLRFRFVPALSCMALTLLLAACGGGSKATATVAPPTAVPTATTAPTSAPTAAPTATAVPATAPTTAPARPTQAPTAAATIAPTRTAGATTAVQAAAVTPVATQAAPTAQSGPPQAHQLPGGTIMLPAGFDIGVFASNVGQARFMAVRPSDGALFVADQNGRILILPDANHDGKADGTIVFASGLNLPSSIAFYQDWVYVGETNQVSRFKATDNAVQPQGAKEIVIPNLPTGGHFTRTVAFGPDGKLYLSIGSSCNVCNEKDERRAAISVYNPDGTNGRLFATGLRNAVGITWQPGTNQMWAAVNGRDNLGDNLPPDDLRKVNDGVFYGWPYCYNGPNPNPEYKDPSKCANVPVDDVALPAHSAALGLTFGDRFNAPQAYKESIYIAYHGSWNRSVKTGYKVVRVPMVNGTPGQPQDFAWGWLPGSADNPGQVWGRPVGVTVGSDGALYVTDDSGGRVYRIAATG
jgi:glucose/arabinose dehydrogenase